MAIEPLPPPAPVRVPPIEFLIPDAIEEKTEMAQEIFESKFEYDPELALTLLTFMDHTSFAGLEPRAAVTSLSTFSAAILRILHSSDLAVDFMRRFAGAYEKNFNGMLDQQSPEQLSQIFGELVERVNVFEQRTRTEDVDPTEILSPLSFSIFATHLLLEVPMPVARPYQLPTYLLLVSDMRRSLFGNVFRLPKRQ